MLPSKRPLYMGNILILAPKIGNINLPTLITLCMISNIHRCENFEFFDNSHQLTENEISLI